MVDQIVAHLTDCCILCARCNLSRRTQPSRFLCQVKASAPTAPEYECAAVVSRGVARIKVRPLELSTVLQPLSFGSLLKIA